MAEQAERKAQLIATLEVARGAFVQNFQEFRRDVDVPAHLKQGFRRHKTLYLTGAAGIGWVLARLPARKKKIYIDRGENRKIKQAGEMGLLGLLFVALKFLFSIFRPAIAAFAARKISTLAERYERPEGRPGVT